MPLGLVPIQQLAHLPVQPRIDVGQTLDQILVYGALAHAEVCGRGAHGTLMFQQIDGQIAGPLLNAVSQLLPLPVPGEASPRVSASTI